MKPTDKDYIVFVSIQANNYDKAIENFWNMVQKEGKPKQDDFNVRNIMKYETVQKAFNEAEKYKTLKKLLTDMLDLDSYNATEFGVF